ncbi:MAG TPA: hypothetical protein VFQ88_04650 [Nevskiaceae bacterium]|nr:hypothetical protein [Nevskiaceae bacterium]
MSAAEVLAQCKTAGVELALHEDRLSYEGPDSALAALLPLVKVNKAGIVALLKAANDPADLPDKVRARLADTAAELGLAWQCVLSQFERWAPYPPHDWQEMAAWPDTTMQAHARALWSEYEAAQTKIVTCVTCRHFTPGTVNATSGVGSCDVDAWKKSKVITGRAMPCYPNAERYCGQFEAQL